MQKHEHVFKWIPVKEQQENFGNFEQEERCIFCGIFITTYGEMLMEYKAEMGAMEQYERDHEIRYDYW